MKVLMLGWEFPPFIAGGLGTACYGLTRAMNVLGVDVLFVLPRPVVAHAATGVLAEARGAGHFQRSETPRAQVTMVGAHYGFPHAQQAGTPTVAAPGQAEGERTGEALASAAAGGEAVMSYTDYNVNEFDHVTFRTLDAMLSPYMTPEEYRHAVRARERAGASTPVPPGVVPAAVAVPAGRREVGGQKVREELPRRSVVKSVSVPAQAGMRNEAARVETNHRSPPPQEFRLPQSMLSPPQTSYSVDLMAETQRYATMVAGIAHDETFDVIHAHDWMTFRAGVAARRASGMPLIVHVHSTEYDRNPRRPDPAVVAIETEGLAAADRVIAVSHMTRRLLVTRYGVDEEKVEVVHNAIDGEQLAGAATGAAFPVRKDEKVVLFLGRITAQKGPEYFLAAARKVLDVYEPVKFIMAGAGDLMKPTVELAAAMGIGHKVLFTGFLNARDVEKIYQMADLYVMPSVSEPFGIAPLEALSHNVPVIISKQSGVAEILQHALKVDFWDVDALADRILAVLRHAPLANTLREHAREEVRKLSWVDAAKHLREIYVRMAGETAPPVISRAESQETIPPVRAPAALHAT